MGAASRMIRDEFTDLDITKQKRALLRRIKAGVCVTCVTCGAERDPASKSRCRRCIERIREYMRRYVGCEARKDGGKGRPVLF